MSYEVGKAAMNLEMPSKIPRTEYSVHDYHWELMNTVTGSLINNNSEQTKRDKVKQEFVKKWDYDFMWNTLIDEEFMRGKKTDMGHATYAHNGADKRKSIDSPFNSSAEVYEFSPTEEYGEFSTEKIKKLFTEDYSLQKQFYPDCINCSGVYITMFSGFIQAFGWEILLKALGRNPEKFGSMARRWERWIAQFFEAFAKTDIEIMMVHDDIVWKDGPITNPSWYSKYIFPAYKRLWKPVIESGKKIIFTSDGDYTEFVDDIAEAGAHGFVFEPYTDMEYVAEHYGDSHVFIGNVDTRVLLNDDYKAVRDEVKKSIKIGRQYPGFFLSVSNHIPPNTPVKKAIYYNSVYENISGRSR